MTGMNRGVRVDNPIIVAAFHSSLSHQLLLIFVAVVLLALAWNVARAMQFRRAQALEATTGHPTPRLPGAACASRAAPGLRRALGARRAAAAAARDADRVAERGAFAGGERRAELGAPRRRRRRDAVVEPPDHRGDVGGVDPARASASPSSSRRAAPGRERRGSSQGGGGSSSGSSARRSAGCSPLGRAGCSASPAPRSSTSPPGLLVALPEVAWRSPALGRWILRSLGALFVAMGVAAGVAGARRPGRGSPLPTRRRERSPRWPSRWPRCPSPRRSPRRFDRSRPSTPSTAGASTCSSSWSSSASARAS